MFVDPPDTAEDFHSLTLYFSSHTQFAGDRRVPSYLAYVVRPDDPVLQDRPGPELGARRSNVDALREL